MNKFTVIVAVALVATSAFASKSRLSSLQDSAHLSDTRDVLNKPDKALDHGEFATMELSGNGSTTNNDSSPNAEGGFVRKMGDNAALGAWLGNKSNLATLSLAEAGAGAASFTTLKNPLNLFYASKMGDMNWGLGFGMTSSEDKVAKTKSTSMGLNGSITGTGWDAQLALGLSGEATAADTTKYAQKSPLALSGGYWMDTLYIYGKYDMYGGKATDIATSTTTKDSDVNNMKIGVVNTHKKDGADFFYGLAYVANSTKVKDGDKTERTYITSHVGIEADATSWMVLRASISQNVLMGNLKVTPSTGTATTDTNNGDTTAVAAGMGLKLGKFTVDGSLAATAKSTTTTVPATSGKLGSDANFLTNVGMTYTF